MPLAEPQAGGAVTVPSCDQPWWSDGPVARFDGHELTSAYVPLTDGTRIAVDRFLPKGLRDGRVTTVLNSTPYFRALEFRVPGTQAILQQAMGGAKPWWPEFARYGYATVVMEQRGCGASFGTRTLDPGAQVNDLIDVVDWIVAQPWSDGRVVSLGVSAPGLAAQLLLTAKHPALVAAVPMFTSFDMYTATHPGGLTYGATVGNVGEMMRALDANRVGDIAPNAALRALFKMLVRGLKPVDRDLLQQAVADHKGNEYIDVGMLKVEFRDDPLPDTAVDTTLEAQSPCAYADDMVASDVPVSAYAGWWDGGSALEMLQLHATVATPGSRIVIGPWGHAGTRQVGPGGGGKTGFDYPADVVRWIEGGGGPNESVVYFTMGENRWKTAACWPPPAQRRRLYLADEGGLRADAPITDGCDTYVVDPAVGSGRLSRWAIDKHPSRGVASPDRAELDRLLLSYTSAPLAHDTEVTGHPLVHLSVSSSADDGAFVVYLEEVAAGGTVSHVTEGALRACDRRVGDAGYAPVAGRVARSFKRADALPLLPGEVAELEFDLYPVSYLFRAGSCVRIAIAGGDADHFRPLPGPARPVVQVRRGLSHPSWLELPVVAE